MTFSDEGAATATAEAAIDTDFALDEGRINPLIFQGMMPDYWEAIKKFSQPVIDFCETLKAHGFSYEIRDEPELNDRVITLYLDELGMAAANFSICRGSFINMDFQHVLPEDYLKKYLDPNRFLASFDRYDLEIINQIVSEDQKVRAAWEAIKTAGEEITSHYAIYNDTSTNAVFVNTLPAVKTDFATAGNSVLEFKPDGVIQSAIGKKPKPQSFAARWHNPDITTLDLVA